MISLIVNVDDPNQSGLLETFASVRKTEQTNFVISGEELTFFHRPVKVSTTATQPWEDDWLASDAFEFAIGLPGEDFVAYSDTYTAANPGVNGTITVNTVAVVAAFADTTDDALPFVFSIKRTRVSGEVAEYYQAHCTLKRSVINPGSAIPTPSASYYTKTESDSRFAPLSSVVTTGTGLWYLSSGAPSVLTVGSGLTIVGSTISATGGGGSGTAYLYADQEFTGTNNFGVATFDPSDSTFGDSPTLRLASGSYVMVAGDETGEAGVISNSGGSLVLESALGTNYNVGEGIMYGLPGGTLNLATQSLTGDWGFTAPPSVIMSGDTPPALILNRGIAAKSRVLAMKSGESTDPIWTGFAMTVNADWNPATGYTFDDEAQTFLVLNNEYQWYNSADHWYQSELNWAASGRRILNLWTRTQSEVTTVSSGSGVGGVTVTTADNHNFSIGTVVYLSVAGTSPALAGTFTVVATPSAKTFTITPATAITGVSTAAQRGTVRASTGDKTVSIASFQVLAPLSVEVPSYDTGSPTDPLVAGFYGYKPQSANYPLRVRIQNNSVSDAGAGTEIEMKGIGNSGTFGGWWKLSTAYDPTTGTTTGNTFIISNGLSGGYGLRLLPKTGALSTTYVGINKGTPAKELDVVGDGRFTGDVSAATLSGITSLSDSNGEPLLNFNATADAVNQITIVNAAAGNAPVIAATGSDTNIGLVISPAGTGNLELGSLGVIAFTGSVAQDVNGAASKPAALFAGTPFAGTGTTSFPLVYINDADAMASTTLNTAGTYFGVNGNGTQDLMNLLKDGVSLFKVTSAGASTVILPNNGTISNGASFLHFGGALQVTNCNFVVGTSSNNGGSRFNVCGAASIGETYHTIAAPTSGAIFEGNVLIGKSTDGGQKLQVSGTVDFSSNLAVTGETTLTGNLTSNGAFISTPQALTGAGAVNVTTHITKLTTSGIGQALTLADGANGQRKVIIYAVEGGGTDTAILTPTTKTGFTTITFAVVGDSVELVFFTTQGWMIASIHGAVAA